MNHKVDIHFGKFQICTLKKCKISTKRETNLFEKFLYYKFGKLILFLAISNCHTIAKMVNTILCLALTQERVILSKKS